MTCVNDRVADPRYFLNIFVHILMNFIVLGFWMLRDEQSKGYTRGMDIVFQVGSQREMVSSPTGFPSCGSFVGPDFFLI